MDMCQLGEANDMVSRIPMSISMRFDSFWTSLVSKNCTLRSVCGAERRNVRLCGSKRSFHDW
jgi:hypothetical protein